MISAIMLWTAILAMGGFYSLCLGQQRSADAELHAQRAQAAIASNRPTDASVELEALLRLTPNDVNARASLGMVQFTQGNYEQAEINFNAAVSQSLPCGTPGPSWVCARSA